jgi:2,4-dienoyl-CoA reductase-like NADH-dependent reductase (Old Yellow Enzyme family)
MYEHLAALFGGPPNALHISLYSKWATHGWGMIITGNVQVDASHLSLGRDIVIPQVLTEKSVQPFRDLASTIALHSPSHQNVNVHSSTTEDQARTLAIIQLSHAGRQSPNFLGGRSLFAPPLAPSATPVGSTRGYTQTFVSGLFHSLLFRTPVEMSSAAIDDVVERFVRGARLAVDAGFDGVQLHMAHGCEFDYGIGSRYYVEAGVKLTGVGDMQIFWHNFPLPRSVQGPIFFRSQRQCHLPRQIIELTSTASPSPPH